MTKLKYDTALNKDELLKKQAQFYDEVDVAQAFDFQKKIVKRAATKRVNIVLPDSLYRTALKLGETAGTGYQNALKMAIVIGLNELKIKTKI